MSRKLLILIVVIIVIATGAYIASADKGETTFSQAIPLVSPDSSADNALKGKVNQGASGRLSSSVVPTTASTPVLADSASIPVPVMAAKAWMLLDMQSGQIIAQHNADQRLAPASLTKLLTASLVFSALDEHRIHLDQTVTVSERAWRTGGSRMFIEVNKKVSVGDLLQGLIVQSGNDATIQLAETVGGTVESFVDKMNQAARSFGMLNSNFGDPTGLPLHNTYTTVRDLSVLAQHVIRDHPTYFHYFSQKEFTYNKIRQANRNGLLSRQLGVDGLKTGHTEDAGYCLISTALRDKRRVLAIVMGTQTIAEREQASQDLLNWAYANFTNQQIMTAGNPIFEPRVYEGVINNVRVSVPKGYAVTIPRGQEQQVQMLTQYPEGVLAPLKKGDTVGLMQFVLNGKIIAQTPLVAEQDVPQAGFIGRLWDKIIRFF